MVLQEEIMTKEEMIESIKDDLLELEMIEVRLAEDDRTVTGLTIHYDVIAEYVYDKIQESGKP